MSRCIAIANQKGGVGKTTTCVNLASGLAAAGQQVLLVDLDAQGNATMAAGINKYELPHSTLDVLFEPERFASVRVCVAEGFDLLPANSDLVSFERRTADEEQRYRRLEQALAAVAAAGASYDFVLIDCPPALGALTLNALVAADEVLVPVQCEYYALEGLTDLLDTVAQVREHLNPRLKLGGMVRTMFDARNRLARDVSAQLSRHFGPRLYRTIIPRNVRIAEAPSHGRSVLAYDRASPGALAYQALVGEFQRRARRPESTAP